MFCPNCGNQTQDSAKFCPSCGQSLAMSAGYQQLAKDFSHAIYAGFWKRAAAYLIDIFIISAIGGALGVALALFFGDVHDLETTSPLVELSINIAGALLAWLYYALMESSVYQATIGKMILGIKVTDLSGERVSFLRATGRHFGQIISGILLGIGYLMAAFTAKKQTLHDIMAGCLVVNK